MRVIHLTRDLPPHAAGGVSVAVAGLVAAERAAGIECAVLSFDGWRPRRRAPTATPPQRLDDGGPLLRVRDPGQAERATNELCGWGAQVVHAHDGLLWEHAEALAQRCGIGGATCYTAHVVQAEMQHLRGLGEPTLSAGAEQRALAAAGAVVAVSEAAAERLLHHHPAVAPRLVRIGLGAVLPAPPLLAADRAGLLYVGRFTDVKGTAELFAAAAELLARFPALELTVAGGNPESPRSERRWRRRAAELVPAPLQSRLRFTGWLERAALAEELDRALALLCPSWFESFGLAALEAMAHALPVVGSTGGALPELVEHGRCGLLSPPRDVASLVRHAAALIETPERARQMGIAARQRVAERFQWPEVAIGHRELYARLASATG